MSLRTENPERDYLIYSRVDAGETLRGVAKDFNLSAERVRQIHAIQTRRAGVMALINAVDRYSRNLTFGEGRRLYDVIDFIKKRNGIQI